MPVAEALAIDQHLYVEEQNPEKDVQDLEKLAQWAERYSPIVGLEEDSSPQSLLLDISGCAAFFRGEDKLLERAVRELAEQGWRARTAIADTIGTAWGLAHYAPTPWWAAPGETEKVLRPLPIAALRLPAQTIDLLSSLGMERVEQLLELPRASLPARFGALVLRRLDQALGRLPEVIVPHRSLTEIKAVHSFEYPTDRLEVLHYVLDRLCQRIHKILQSRNWGARQLECWLYHQPSAARPLRIEVGLFRPTCSAQHFAMLLRTRLEQVRIAEPIGALGLRVSAAEPLTDGQAEFFETESGAGELPGLIDRLSNRLGRQAVTRPTLVPDPQPEYACRFEPILQIFDFRFSIADFPQIENRKWKIENGLRPLRLRPRPVPIEVIAVVPEGPLLRFRWQGVEYRVIRSWGPERIETGWWRGQDVHRDYYIVATHLGNRFWVFRRQDDGRWFLHGCFD